MQWLEVILDITKLNQLLILNVKCFTENKSKLFFPEQMSIVIPGFDLSLLELSTSIYLYNEKHNLKDNLNISVLSSR